MQTFTVDRPGSGAPFVRALGDAGGDRPPPCRPFDPEVAATIAVHHFGGEPTVRMLQR